MAELTRRQFIGAAAGLSLVGTAMSTAASGLTINPRSSWGAAHPPKGPLADEDVRFLLVHHSASKNGHESADVPRILRGWFDFHTGPDKGWNDIAYNFIIDREGGIWEGRQGSISGAIAGDATGGNQGFSQLVCLIGDFDVGSPTGAALDSLTRTLAWLADRHGVSTSTGSAVTFTSRGSSRWPAGTSVTSPTIVGHRDMSSTSCPGDNLYPYVVSGLMADVHAVRTGEPSSLPAPTGSISPTTASAPVSTTTSTTVPATTTTSAGSTTSTSSPSTYTTSAVTSTTVSSTTRPSSTTSVAAATSTSMAVLAGAGSSGGGSGLLIGAGLTAAAVTGLVVWRQRRTSG